IADRAPHALAARRIRVDEAVKTVARRRHRRRDDDAEPGHDLDMLAEQIVCLLAGPSVDEPPARPQHGIARSGIPSAGHGVSGELLAEPEPELAVRDIADVARDHASVRRAAVRAPIAAPASRRDRDRGGDVNYIVQQGTKRATLHSAVATAT